MPVTRLSEHIPDLDSAIRLNRWILQTNALPDDERRVVQERLQMLEIKLGLAVAELETELTERPAVAA